MSHPSPQTFILHNSTFILLLSNWTSIASADVLKAGNPKIVAAAEAQSPGSTSSAIADAVSAIRGAVSTGNNLDADAMKVPNSLKGVTARVAFWSLMDLLLMELTKDQVESRKTDQSRIDRITDHKIRFEAPDTPAGNAEMQDAQGAVVIQKTRRMFRREDLRHL